MSTITVGAEAIDRANYQTHPRTMLCLENPANADGKINIIEIYPYTTIPDLKVGFFYLIGPGNTYKCRSAVTIGQALQGGKRTFAVPLMDIKTGDVIACWFTDGTIRSGNGGLPQDTRYSMSDEIVVGHTYNFVDAWTGQNISLHGIGSTPEGGTSPSVMGLFGDFR